MKRETKSILDYLKAIAWVVIPFCLLGSLHYLFVFFPRTACEKDNHILFNHLGFDYFGVVVGFFTLLVTLLVGWQIFSNIKERERIEKLTESNEKFRGGLDGRIKALEDCCNERQKEISEMNNKIDVSINSILLLMTSDNTLTTLKGKLKDERLSMTDAFMASQAFHSILKAVYQLLSTKTENKNIRGSIVKLQSCLTHLNGRGQFNKFDYDQCTSLFSKISLIISDEEIANELQQIQQDMIAISWDKEWEERRADFIKFEEERNRLEAEEAARQSTEAKGDDTNP